MGRPTGRVPGHRGTAARGLRDELQPDRPGRHGRHRHHAAIFHAVFEDDEHDGATKASRLAAARAADDPWTALLETVDLLASPSMEPLVPALVMEAMVQAYRDPELDALLSHDNAEERSTVTTLLQNAAAAGQIDTALDPDDTAAWIMALIAALYTSAATDPSFNPADQLPTLRLILQRFLRPDAVTQPEP